VIDFPSKLAPLFEPHRFKVLYGGRDGGKSWSIARALLLLGARQQERILCTREVQRTIADSVHKLLVDQIDLMNLREFYTVTDNSIVGSNGTEFMFAGLHQQTAENLKSYEGVTRCWAEEGHNISKRSWGILEPTIRKEGSEIWVSFNPNMDTDFIWTHFISDQQPDSLVIKLTWRDNPWRSKVLDATREKMARDDPQQYEHVYEGKCNTVVAGAIYAGEVVSMIEEGRYRACPYDPKLRVHTIWDLGWNDQTAIIFAQRLLSEVRIIDYEEESFLKYSDWAVRIHKKPYVYGDHYLPHDGANQTQGGDGISAQSQLKPLLGKQPKIIKRPGSVEDPIRSSRMMFPRTYMDQAKCARLMDCLKRFRRGIPETTGEPGKPLKDEYRHGADAFGGLSLIVDKLTNDADEMLLIPQVRPRPNVRGLGM